MELPESEPDSREELIKAYVTHCLTFCQSNSENLDNISATGEDVTEFLRTKLLSVPKIVAPSKALESALAVVENTHGEIPDVGLSDRSVNKNSSFPALKLPPRGQEKKTFPGQIAKDGAAEIFSLEEKIRKRKESMERLLPFKLPSRGRRRSFWRILVAPFRK